MTKILIIAFLIRLIISFLPAFEIDQNDWRLWSIRLANEGAGRFYSKDVFTDYTPGFLYYLWFAGIIKNTFLPTLELGSPIYDLILKLPANIADVLTGMLIYLILKKAGEKLARIASLLYIFNPAIFFNSSIWGQFDGISTLLALTAVFLILKNKSLNISSIFLAAALSLKPQAIFLLPAIGIKNLITYKPFTLLCAFVIFFIMLFIIYLPFIFNDPFTQFININLSVGNVFNCTTCFAFNFWGIFGNWQNDLEKFLTFPKTYWGIILSIILSFIILLTKPFKIKFKEPFIYLTIALTVISYYTFLTRMHERYLFPFFAFFLVAAFLLKSKKLLFFYFLFSLLNLINQYLPYAYYNFVYLNKTNIFNPPFISFLTNNFRFMSGIFLASFLGLLISSLQIIRKHE